MTRHGNMRLGTVQSIVRLAKHNKKISTTNKPLVVKSNLTIDSEMPPKMTLGIRPPSPIKTRQQNKNQHPGIADAPKPCHSHAKMEAIHVEAAQKKKTTEQEKQKALKHIADRVWHG